VSAAKWELVVHGKERKYERVLLASKGDYDRSSSFDPDFVINSRDEGSIKVNSEKSTMDYAPVSNAISLISPVTLANLDAILPKLKAKADDTTFKTTLVTLPNEIKLHIFSDLSPMDACALGLAHPNLYAVFKEVWKTKMPLSTRQGFGGIGGIQDGGKGYLEQGARGSTSGPTFGKALMMGGGFGVNRGMGGSTLESAWEVVGKSDCENSCGSGRCALWRHVEGFFKGMEYCRQRGVFVKKADNKKVVLETVEDDEADRFVEAEDEDGDSRICERKGPGGDCKKHPKPARV